jgi:hypothetical protein
MASPLREFFLLFLRGLARQGAPRRGYKLRELSRAAAVLLPHNPNPGGKDGPLRIALVARRADSDSAADLSIRRAALANLEGKKRKAAAWRGGFVMGD